MVTLSHGTTFFASPYPGPLDQDFPIYTSRRRVHQIHIHHLTNGGSDPLYHSSKQPCNPDHVPRALHTTVPVVQNT